jgi:hypothetical protein
MKVNCWWAGPICGVAQYGMWAETAPVGLASFLFQIIQTFPIDFQKINFQKYKSFASFSPIFSKHYQMVDKFKRNNFPF